MMKRLVKPVSILILIAYLMTLPVSALAAVSTAGTATASDLLNRWKSYGVIDKSTTAANLNEPVQKIDFIMFLNSILKTSNKADIAFGDVPPGSWYGNEIAKAVAAGYIDNGKADYRPFTNITRLEAAMMAARLFGLELRDSKLKSKISDAGSLDDRQLTYFAALIENGGISEVAAGRYAPTGVLKLSDALKILDACAGEIVTKAGAVTKSAAGNMIITVGAVNLNNIEIGGNLIVGEGVANGSIRLENVRIQGSLIVRGGGTDGVTLRNTQVNQDLVVEKMQGMYALRLAEIPQYLRCF